MLNPTATPSAMATPPEFLQGTVDLLILRTIELQPRHGLAVSERIAQITRGTFVVNPEGQIKVAEIHDLGIGRDASELLRKVKAAQYVASHPGEVCPAKWTEGAETLKPSLDLVGKI